jgi:4'-phosphopantetheinyl transferase
LSEDESNKAGRFHFKKHRDKYIICRGILRCLLGEYTGIEPAKIIFKYNNFGKPKITECQNLKDIRFNVSHSEEYGLIGITHGQEIGVDIEKIKPINEMMNIVKNLFTPYEKEIFYKNNEIVQFDAFYRWWIQKEAIIKAIGLGMNYGLNRFDLDFVKTHSELEIPPYRGQLSTYVLKQDIIFCLFVLKDIKCSIKGIWTK